MSKSPKKFLFLVDDGWRYERRELLYFLKGKVSFDIATHEESTFRYFSGDFKVHRIDVHPLKGTPLFNALMFFTKDLDTNLARTVRNVKVRTRGYLMRVIFLLQDLAGLMGLRRLSQTRVLEFLYRRSDCYGEILRNYDAILYNPVLSVDKRIVFEAKRKGLGVICSIFSWDNPMKDSEFITDADRYFVWNESSRKYLETLHGIPPERVDIVGPTQFDYLLEMRKRPPSSPSRRYVLFTCSLGVHDFWIDQETDIILMVRRVLDEIDPSVLLLVRPYPFAAQENPYGALLGREGIELAEFGKFKVWKLEISREDVEEKYYQIKDALCLVNLGSTIGLEASFTATPILQLAFNVPNELPAWQDLKEVLKNDHLELIFDTRFPNVVHDEAKLKDVLHDLIEGKVDKYLDYSRMLQDFANPMQVDAYREVFLQALERF